MPISVGLIAKTIVIYILIILVIFAMFFGVIGLIMASVMYLADGASHNMSAATSKPAVTTAPPPAAAPTKESMLVRGHTPYMY